jgi:hypothetical protein
MSDSPNQSSESQDARPHGSRLGSMFGYVTPQDRQQWESMREANKPRVSAAKAATKSATTSLMHSMDSTLTSQMRAADQIAAKEHFEESNTREVTQRYDAKTQRIEETVEWTPRDERAEIEPDFDFEQM